MSKKVKIIIASICVAAFLSGGAAMIAFASEECQAGCQLQYSKCKKGCGDNLDCKLDCLDAKDDCISGCGN